MFNSVIKQICFKNLEDIIPTYLHDVSRLLPHNQPRSQRIFSLWFKDKKALETRLSNNVKKKVLPCFVVESWSGKGQNGNFFICPSARTPLFYQL